MKRVGSPSQLEVQSCWSKILNLHAPFFSSTPRSTVNDKTNSSEPSGAHMAAPLQLLRFLVMEVGCKGKYVWPG